MSTTQRGTEPSTRPNSTAKSPIPDADALNKRELAALHLLGYKNTDLAAMPLSEARRMLEVKRRKETAQPERAAPVAQPAVQAPGFEKAAAVYSDQRLAETLAPEPTDGLEIRMDEFTQKCVAGNDPLDATIIECEAAYPDCVVRLFDPTLSEPAGTKWQTIYRVNGHAVEIGRLIAKRMPKDVYHTSYVLPNQQRSETMSGQRRPVSEGDSDAPLPAAQALLVPLEGEGLHMGAREFMR